MKKLSTITLLISLCMYVNGQRKIMNIPDIPGFVTLKCDFHMHTVFSDGNVWPTVRIDEAIRDGLDAIAITDHLEYTPKKEFIPVNHNAAWKLTEGYARDRNLILIHGTEITKGKMPPGHFNALFINDAVPIAKDSIYDACAEAVRQGAYIMWNHPGWKSQQPDGIPRMYEIHRRLVKNKMLHGIEFFNDSDFYPAAFSISDQNNLTLMASSDVHGVISEQYKGVHRPMTLVLAKERSHDAIKEALFARRTIALFNDMLAGKEEYVRQFFNGCVTVGKPFYQNDKSIMFEVKNSSDIPFILINGTSGAPGSITLEPNSATRVVLGIKVNSPLTYDVMNVMTGEKSLLKVELKY